MINKKAIEEVYRRYRKKPKGIDELNVAILFDSLADVHGLTIEDEKIVLRSVDDKSLFRTIALSRVYGIVNFEETVGIVLHSSIIFLNKKEPKVNVHIKPEPKTFMQKVKMWFGR